jgi:hypothetical protein
MKGWRTRVLYRGLNNLNRDDHLYRLAICSVGEQRNLMQTQCIDSTSKFNLIYVNGFLRDVKCVLICPLTCPLTCYVEKFLLAAAAGTGTLFCHQACTRLV